jgi:hypothetical protein
MTCTQSKAVSNCSCLARLKQPTFPSRLGDGMEGSIAVVMFLLETAIVARCKA